jgi:hypothetical protein
VAIATAPASAPATFFRPQGREIAEDRWQGLMLDRDNPNRPSDIAIRLDAIIGELAGGMGREPITDNELGSGTILDLDDLIGEWLIQWVMAGGVSPTTEDDAVVFSVGAA